MKTIFLLVMTIVLGAESRAVAAADPAASATTKTVLSYLTNLPNRTDHRIVSGQWLGWNGFDIYGTALLDKTFEVTKFYPGLVGVDTTTIVNGVVTYTLTGSLPNLINQWRLGALIQIEPGFPNPETGKWFNDTTITKFSDAYTQNGNSLNKKFLTELDKLAASLQTLEDNGVTVLFRPFWEMDLGIFWWSSGTEAEFKSLWAYTFNYLTNIKGLHNLLWVYGEGHNGKCMTHYPGSQYVDIVGIDAYNMRGWPLTLPCYKELVATGKPFALTEFGLQAPDGADITAADLALEYNNIIASMPRTTYIMHWDGPWRINRQTNAGLALQNSWIQNRPVPYGSAPTTDSAPPSAPIGLMVK